MRLHAVRKTDGSGPWVPVLLGPYLERQVAPFLPRLVRCAMEPDPAVTSQDVVPRRKQTSAAVSRMLARPVTVLHRGDGKPELLGEGMSVSASHGAGVTLAISGTGRVGCDVEVVRERTVDDWQALLGAGMFALAELVQRERGEELPVAATRVWGAVESLRKAGRSCPGPSSLAGAGGDGWVCSGPGTAKIATFLHSPAR